MSLELRTVNDAYGMLQKLGTSHKLICHVKLVGKAATGTCCGVGSEELLGIICGDGCLF